MLKCIRHIGKYSFYVQAGTDANTCIPIQYDKLDFKQNKYIE